MPYQDRHGNMCGFLDIEEKEVFLRRFFRLDTSSGLLQYFMDNPQNLPPGSKPSGYFQMQFVSLVNDASKTRPKVPHCLSLTVAGNKYFLSANDGQDKDGWIQVLRDCAKITVSKEAPSRRLSDDSVTSEGSGKAPCSYRAEIAGGMVIKTPVDLSDESDSSGDEMEWCIPHVASVQSAHYSEHKPIKAGYCTKQGGKRKNWKRRYFLLDKESLAYFKTSEEKAPLRCIAVKDMMDVRISVGVHRNRDNLFEVVTEKRVFYIQAESPSERDSWITYICRAMNPGKRSSSSSVQRGSKTSQSSLGQTQEILSTPL